MESIKIKVDDEQNLKQKEMHFFNLFSFHYQHDTSTIEFYNQYRNLVIADLKKKGDIIMWRDNIVLAEDEALSPTFEELILAVVLGLINTRLPGYVWDYYHHHLIGKSKSLMDYRMDILSQVPSFLLKMEGNLTAVAKSDEDPHVRYGTRSYTSVSKMLCLLKY
jgi:hypothetical protein